MRSRISTRTICGLLRFFLILHAADACSAAARGHATARTWGITGPFQAARLLVDDVFVESVATCRTLCLHLRIPPPDGTRSQAFILVERSDDAMPVYVWIGADYDGVSDPEDEEVILPSGSGTWCLRVPNVSDVMRTPMLFLLQRVRWLAGMQASPHGARV